MTIQDWLPIRVREPATSTGKNEGAVGGSFARRQPRIRLQAIAFPTADSYALNGAGRCLCLYKCPGHLCGPAEAQRMVSIKNRWKSLSWKGPVRPAEPTMKWQSVNFYLERGSYLEEPPVAGQSCACSRVEAAEWVASSDPSVRQRAGLFKGLGKRGWLEVRDNELGGLTRWWFNNSRVSGVMAERQRYSPIWPRCLVGVAGLSATGRTVGPAVLWSSALLDDVTVSRHCTGLAALRRRGNGGFGRASGILPGARADPSKLYLRELRAGASQALLRSPPAGGNWPVYEATRPPRSARPVISCGLPAL